jgi:hypothetical protein
MSRRHAQAGVLPGTTLMRKRRLIYNNDGTYGHPQEAGWY